MVYYKFTLSNLSLTSPIFYKYTTYVSKSCERVFDYRLEQTGTFETRLECGIETCVEGSRRAPTI